MSKQTTLSGDTAGVDGGTAGGSPDNISELLESDEGLDRLTREEVKDVWVRSTFARNIMRAAAWHDSEDYYTRALCYGRDTDFKTVAIRAFGRDGPARALDWEAEPGANTAALWDRWTKSDVDGDTVEIARERLKTSLRGCGMPRMRVARKRLKELLDRRESEEPQGWVTAE